MNKPHKLKVVVVGGGTGTFTVLSGLRRFDVDITAIVSTADDGGSTGILRDELGVLPPGDIRQALVALSKQSPTLRKLFTYRFSEGTFTGHNFGNLFLSALEKITGSFDKAVLLAGKVLNIKGQVVPMTNTSVHLFAKTNKGKIVRGQHTIDTHIWSEQDTITKLWLEPECEIHPKALEAIQKANIIVLGPGSIFTSIIPNLLVHGMSEALAVCKGKVVLISNLMTEKGQTNDFSVQDYADTIQTYLGQRTIDMVLYNTKMPNEELLSTYRLEKERIPVTVDKERLQVSYELIGTNLLSHTSLTEANDALAAQRTLIRHDPLKLAKAIYEIGTNGTIQKSTHINGKE